MSRVLRTAMNAHWAMEEEALRRLLAIAAREHGGLEAVQAELGRPLSNTRQVTTRDGFAVLPVTGPIFRYADFFTDISGATALATLATDFSTALAAPGVQGIILDIDSPGGEAAGINDFAQMIYDARGTKPIVAFIDGDGASAAYWIASAADEVVVGQTAIVGSIGVRASFTDYSEANKKRGIESISIVSSQSPDKALDPKTSDGRAKLQVLIDGLADVFVDSVARNRGVSRETVLSDFGQGGVFVGQAAVAAGLADRVSTFEALLQELSDEPTGLSVLAPAAGGQRIHHSNSENPMSKENTDTPAAAASQPEITSQYLADNHADLVASISTAGATAERERICAILDLNPAAEDSALVREMVADASIDQGAAAIKLREAESTRRVASLKQDTAALPDVKPGASGGDETTNLINAVLTAGQAPATA